MEALFVLNPSRILSIRVLPFTFHMHIATKILVQCSTCLIRIREFYQTCTSFLRCTFEATTVL